MLIPSATILTKVKQEFEGGSSLAVDWDNIIVRAAKYILKKASPSSVKRSVPIYGGLSKDLNYYYCPTDVYKPSEIYTNDGKREFSYVPPRVFYRETDEENIFTIEIVNGVKMILTRKSLSVSTLIVDTMDTVGTKTGGTPTLNEHNYLTGAGAIDVTLTDAGIEFGDTFDEAQDITDYLKGIGLVPCKMPTAANLASLELRLKTDDSNYFSISSTSDSIGDYFRDGWNMVRFSLANLSETGSPDAENITKWSIVGTTVSGETMTVTFDKITLQETNPYYFEYISKNIFADSNSVLWKTESEFSYAQNYQIMFEDELEDVLHYEICIRVQPNDRNRFEGDLKRAWDDYWGENPSDEVPLSYNIEQIEKDNFYSASLQDTTEAVD